MEDYKSVDDLMDEAMRRPPRGGEIKVEQVECFDRPFGPKTPEETARFVKYGMAALERWRNETPAQAAEREAFEERVKEAAASTDPNAVRDLVKAILADNPAA